MISRELVRVTNGVLLLLQSIRKMIQMSIGMENNAGKGGTTTWILASIGIQS